MRYSREDYNSKLLSELQYSEEKKSLTSELKILFFELADDISKNKKRYPFIDEDTRILCVLNACEVCMKHALNFNREKSDNAFAYISTIIRCSFAGTLKKEWDKNIK